MTAALLGLGAVLVALLAYGALIEPRRVELTRAELHLPRWPRGLDGLTILHLSDLHTRGRGPAERWLERLRAELPRPDLIAVTGDFAETIAALPACLAAIGGWPARFGSYAVLGNNDQQSHWQRRAVAEALAGAGITLLADNAVELEVNGQRLRVAGLRYVSARHSPPAFRFAAAQAAGPADCPRIVLAHSPDSLPEAVDAGVDLILAGHTHGGQICLPGGRPIENNLQRFKPPLYTRGAWRVDDTLLVVSRGLGMTRPLLRTFCRPEAAWLVLRGAESEQG